MSEKPRELARQQYESEATLRISNSELELPLVFPVPYPVRLSGGGGPLPTVEIRSLAGMQKEAIVAAPGGGCWRMVCDEGAYLNGTDLAPFPLGFFAAGQLFSLQAEVRSLALRRNVMLRSLEIQLDSFYGMEGSFLKGSAQATAAAPEFRIELDCDAPAEAGQQLVHQALDRSMAHTLLRDQHASRFSLTLNGREISLSSDQSTERNGVGDPISTFQSLVSEAYQADEKAIISKAKTAVVRPQETGSSLSPEQKRTVHVRGQSRLIDSGMAEATVWPIRPSGSHFRFLADVSPRTSSAHLAPPPIAYVTAGIGFCFMTQLGRYAHIKDLPLQGYRIVQQFRQKQNGSMNGPAGRDSRFETHVFVDTTRARGGDEHDHTIQDLVHVAERTCFLHAALRGSHPAKTTVLANGQPFENQLENSVNTPAIR